VTDYTSMLVVREDVMESEGIERRNARRVSKERDAQLLRSSAPVKSYRVDDSAGGQGGTFGGARSHNVGSGPVGPLLMAFIVWFSRRKRDFLQQ
jgi:Ca-activated chloride channel homolog